MTPNRLPILMFVVMGLVVVALIGVLAASWVWFAVATAIYGVGTGVFLLGWGKNARGSQQADPESQKLDRWADEAAGDRPRAPEAEVEALKRGPSRQL